MRVKWFNVITIATIALLFVYGCSQATQPTAPDSGAVTPDDFTMSELVFPTITESERSADWSYCTEMTPDEIAQWLAVNVIETYFTPFPDSVKCYLYQDARVRIDHQAPWEEIGLYGMFSTYKTDTELEALADAMCIMGYDVPEFDPPPSPCE